MSSRAPGSDALTDLAAPPLHVSGLFVGILRDIRSVKVQVEDPMTEVSAYLPGDPHPLHRCNHLHSRRQ
ncbi:hypothetical protein O3P69_002037 [Scylla paramamosain]|uniref:Uncharacterized protein n=1 Tax=Scylla paramamosain TaxID=85552 RepID=A0AAW0V7Q7_SCYPA